MAFGKACSPCLLGFHFIIAKEATRALGRPTTCLGAGLAAAVAQWGLAGWCSNALTNLLDHKEDRVAASCLSCIATARRES